MNTACIPQATRILRKSRQLKGVRLKQSCSSAPPSTSSHNGHHPSPVLGRYGHVLPGTSPFGGVENHTSSDSTTSSPASIIAREGSTHNIVATIEPICGYRSSSGQANPVSHLPPTPPTFSPKKPLQPGFGITWDQAEQAIADFRTKFTPFFPFVVLDPRVSPQEILSKKPLLFRAIMLIAVPLTLAKRKEIERSMLAYIGQHLLVMDERDLGLLQGVLVFVAWNIEDFYLDQKHTSLIYLAMGYAHKLGISRPPLTMQQKMMLAVDPRDIKEAMIGHALTSVMEESHTPEEQRIFLGCQFLFSANATQFLRNGVLKGDYLNCCLNSLTRPSDPGTDFMLEKIIRFQQIVEQISEIRMDRYREFTMSISNEMQSIRNQLDGLFSNVPREHQQFVLFSAIYNHALVRLYLPASNLSPPSDMVAAQEQRGCMLYCLQATKSFLDTIQSISPEGFLYRTFLTFSDIFFVLVAASRLLLVEIEGWDLDEARATIDFPSTLESIISKFMVVVSVQEQKVAEAAAAQGVKLPPKNPKDEEENSFSKYATKLEWIKNWFEIHVSTGCAVSNDTQTMNGPSYWAPENQTWNPFMFGFLGDDNLNIEF